MRLVAIKRMMTRQLIKSQDRSKIMPKILEKTKPLEILERKRKREMTVIEFKFRYTQIDAQTDQMKDQIEMKKSLLFMDKPINEFRIGVSIFK